MGCQQEGHYSVYERCHGEEQVGLFDIAKSRRSISIDWWIWSAGVIQKWTGR